MEFAYTLGRTESYDRAISETPGVKKLGAYPPTKDDPNGYEGGWVWRTPKEAEQFRIDQLSSVALGFYELSWNPEEFSIYEIELPTGWENDVTSEIGKDLVHHLLTDSIILRKIIL